MAKLTYTSKRKAKINNRLVFILGASVLLNILLVISLAFVILKS